MSEQNSNPTLWRYLSFDKFIDLLETSELYFAEPKQFDDSWECYPPQGMLNKSNWKGLLEQQPNQFIKKLDKYWLDKLIENTIASFEAAYFNESRHFFSCWTMAEQDHAGFWDLYTDKKNGVAISTDSKSLISSIKENRNILQRIFLAEVQYIDFEAKQMPPAIEVNYSHKNTLHYVPQLYKRRSYEHEQEARLSFHRGWEGGLLWNKRRIQVNLDKMIKKVVIAPLANNSFHTHVTNLVQEKLPYATVEPSVLKFTRKPSENAIKYNEGLNIRRQASQEKKERLYCLFDTFEDYENWNKKVCDLMCIPAFGYNSATGFLDFSSSGTLKWSSAEKHPSPGDSRVVALANRRLASDRELYTEDKCREMGWFPNNNID